MDSTAEARRYEPTGPRERSPYWHLAVVAILTGIAIAAATVLGSELVSKLGVNRTFESTALLAVGTFFGTFMFVVSGGLIGFARAQQSLRNKLETALGEKASKEARDANRAASAPGRSLSPNQQAILGLVGTIVTALLGFLGVVLQVLIGSGGSGG